MLKKIFVYILSAVIASCFSACSDDIKMPANDLVPYSPGTLTISLKNYLPSRAEEENPEMRINDLYIGLYGAMQEETLPAIVWKKVSAVSASDKTTLVWKLTDANIQELFDGGSQNTTCRIVVVANVDGLPEKLEDAPGQTSIQYLRNLAISSSFDSPEVPESFVMEGEGDVQYSVSSNSATANVALIRAAAKIYFTINLPEKVEIDGKDETWTPVPEDIKVLLNNGVKDAISAPISLNGGPWKPSKMNAYFSSDATEANTYRTMTEITGAEGVPEGYSKYGITTPYYTYPNTWIENHDGSRKTSLTLMVPWHLEGSEGEPMVYYYQVDATPAGVNYVSRNNYYNIDLTVGMLGSVMPEKPLEVEGTYQIVDWNEEELNIPIQDSRYLVVSPNVYTMNNEEEITIPYYTSHPAEISDITITYKRFNFYNDNSGDVVDIVIPKDVIDRSVMITDEGTDALCTYSTEYSNVTKQMTVKIKHPLTIWLPYTNGGGAPVNLIQRPIVGGSKEATLEQVQNSIYKYRKPDSPETPYSPYEINVTLSHTDNPSFKQEITITQYPGVYIEAVRNPGGVYNNNYKKNADGTYSPISYDLGYAFVNAVYKWVDKDESGNPLLEPFGYWANNGYAGSPDLDVSSLGSIYPIPPNGNVVNPNMYIITISQFEEGSDYVIGDPRAQHINNDLNGTGNLTDSKDQTTVGEWCYEANALYDGKDESGNNKKRTLRYYYPTQESAHGDFKAKLIAPKFRIASRASVLNNRLIYRVNGRRRVATYQEQGCPAGRWRIPTTAELKFIYYLSAKKIIPALFNANYPYWSAQGPIKVDAQGNVTTYATTGNGFLRMVYDEWYWQEKTDYVLEPDESGAYSYTLGDMPRAPREAEPTN